MFSILNVTCGSKPVFTWVRGNVLVFSGVLPMPPCHGWAPVLMSQGAGASGPRPLLHTDRPNPSGLPCRCGLCAAASEQCCYLRVFAGCGGLLTVSSMMKLHSPYSQVTRYLLDGAVSVGRKSFNNSHHSPKHSTLPVDSVSLPNNITTALLT